jgi:hypothetical protein
MSNQPEGVLPQPSGEPQPLPNRYRMKVLNAVFEKYALNDQISYYQKKTQRSRQAFSQVNILRAVFAFLGGLASAVVAASTSAPEEVVTAFVAVAIVAPALATAIATYSSVYDWERLTKIYRDALNNVYLADALSPRDEMTDEEYYMYLTAYSDAVLDIMHEETAQFGNMIRSSQQIQDFLDKSRQRAQSLIDDFAPSNDGDGN